MTRAGDDRGQRELRRTCAAGRGGRLPDRRAQQQQDGLARRELELGVELRAVEGPRGDDGAGLVGKGEHIAREAEPELRGHRTAVTHAVDREAEQDHIRAPLGDERLERGLVGVVLELGLLSSDMDDLVDAFTVDVERGRVGRDHGDGHRTGELARGRDQLVGDVAYAALQVVRDHQHTHTSFSRTIATMRSATSAAPPSSISAPAPLVGVNIVRTR